MSDQVQGELEWLKLELELSRRAMRKVLKEMEKMDGAESIMPRVRKSHAILKERLAAPYSFNHHKARLARIRDDEPP